MPFNKKEWSKQYYNSNREKINKYRRTWNKNNRKYYREYQQQWKKDNPEKYHKKSAIDTWKQHGIIDEDLSTVYDYFITQTHCWICGVEYNKSYRRCLDHNHDTGEIRYICCSICNRWVVG
jgi:hypothetical protein|tara:strand:+ start:41 stop:403 length:363 start_codon:yes stop_codon:yes gene_type:complete